MANTKYTLCSNPNQGLGIEALVFDPQQDDGYVIEHEGRSYNSIESFDANNMPREIFANKPNFVVAFAGTKVSGGIDTGEPCLVIGVEKKVDSSELSEDEKIPGILPDGVITDIIEFKKLSAFPTCTDGDVSGCPPHDQKHRPLQGGISAIEESGTACTLGLVVKDLTTNNLVALTNNHCVGLLYNTNYDVPTYGSASVVGKNMMQPSPFDGGTVSDIYGTVVRAVPLAFNLSVNNLVDCAISSIGVGDASTKILDINDGPYSFASKSEYTNGIPLYKSGRTTGKTPPPITTIIDDNALVYISYGPAPQDGIYFNNVILYESETRFSQGGDSGSVMLALIGGEYKVVALNFAGNDTGTMGVGCHISDVAAELQIEAWDGDIVVDENSYPSVEVNGVYYERAGDTSNEITHIVDEQFSSYEGVTYSSSSSSSSNNSESSESSVSSSTELETTSSSDSSVSSQSSSSVSSSSQSSSTELMTSSSSSEITPSSSSSEFEQSFENDSPKNLSVQTGGSSSVILSWKAMTKASGYVIERKEGFSDWEILTTVVGVTYTDENIIPGKYYQYRVRGYLDV